MQLAIEEAEAAAQRGEVPVGAVLVDADDKILAQAGNRREERKDPTGHAEMDVLREAAGGEGLWRREGTTLYVTLEPCLMCMGAVIQARVQRVVFGAWDKKAGAAETLYRLGDDPRLNHRVEVQGGLMEERCAALLRDFFRARRRGHRDVER